MSFCRVITTCLAIGLATIPSTSSIAGKSNSLMDLSANGQLLVCSNRDSGTLTVVDLNDQTVLHEVPVGRHPEGATFVGDSDIVAVAVYAEDQIVFVDTKSGEITGTVDVFDEPYSVVSNSEGTRLWVTLEYPGEVIEIDPDSKTVTRSLRAGSFLRGLAVVEDQRLLVTEYYTGVVKSIDLESWSVAEEWEGSPQDNLARQITVHPDWPKAYLPLQRSVTNVAHGSGSIFPYLGIVNLPGASDQDRKRIQMDSFRGTYVVANPWEVAISPDRKRLYIVFSGTDDMFACDVLDDNYFEIEFAGLIKTGANPRAVKVSEDSQSFYVYNALDFTVDVYDARKLTRKATIKVSDWSGDPEVLLGKKLFYSAHPPMTRRRWISCSSCHPDGDSDGRTWQQPEGLRNTQSIRGLIDTHPIHWSADRDEVHDFEHTIRSPLMGGRGLIAGRVNDMLGEPNAGLSRELDALAAYTNSHPFELSPHAKGGLTEQVERGRKLFFSKQVGCAECHSGEFYTDRQMHDIGTGRNDPTEKMETRYDTPTLLGVYRTAPYLHDGTAATLKDVLTTTNPDDQHGRTSDLNDEDINAIVEFLKVLPYETP
ncbi:c-type cytochrome [Thalassoglobus neptunius]|nr:c-type cytochrome [Thalassoglobus neptunius]